MRVLSVRVLSVCRRVRPVDKLIHDRLGPPFARATRRIRLPWTAYRRAQRPATQRRDGHCAHIAFELGRHGLAIGQRIKGDGIAPADRHVDGAACYQLPQVW
jgi:hypothetical protein